VTPAADRAAEVARAFDLGDEARFTGRIERGEQGRVEELHTSRGSFAVKTSFGEADLDGEDAAFQAAARAEGVPATEVMRAAGGAWHAEIGGLPVRVHEWVDLLPPDRGIDPAEAGRLVAAIHRTPFAGSRPEDPWYTDPVGAAAWDRLVQDLAAAAAPFAGDVAGLRNELVALEAFVEPARHLRTCHRDLWAENLRRTTSGGLCVIDWENCGLADPGQEVAGVVFELGIRDRSRGGAVYAVYRDAGGPGAVRTRADFSMTIAQLGHILEIACRIWLDPETTEAERRHQEGRVAEFVDDPFTLAVVDELLEAVGDVD